MKELIVSMVKIGLLASVVASMFAQGLAIVPSQLVLFRERPHLLLRSLLVVIFLVPIADLLIILLLKPSPAVAIGLAILAASPAAPLMLVKVPKSGGSLAYMASLHLILALLALLTVPITLDLLSQALGFRAQVGVAAVAKVVGLSILFPVCLGVVIRSRFVKIADAMSPLLAKVGGVMLLILALFVLAINFGFLLKMDPWSYLAMVLVVATSVAIGHGLGPREPEERTTLAMESASRHPGLAMTIAALNFSPQKALPVLVPYMLVFIVVTTIYLQWRKRSTTKSVGQSPDMADVDITLSKGGKS
jgi:BASS family bile acid:Na+ symporter